ncbi:MAG: hypothetical protein FK730_08980 [Asgard group archaeon]|nr:hypothetical protein [Asgard group archaeon]
MNEKQTKLEKISEESEIEYSVDSKVIKRVKVAEINFAEEYDKKIRNMQIVSMVMVMIITLISPLRLFDSRTIVDLVMVGFVIAGLVPSIYAIYANRRGQKLMLILSILIYSTWIMVLSTFYWEIILLVSILVVYYEITSMLHKIRILLINVKSIAEGGAYYHTNVFLGRYFKNLLKFAGLILATSLILGVVGWYLFQPLQGDILFSIFMIICLVMIVLFSRKTLTPDIQKLMIEEQRDRIEKDLEKSHSRFS